MSVVLISGANSGIGQLAALAFARAGHAVAAGSRSLVRAQELQQTAAGRGIAHRGDSPRRGRSGVDRERRQGDRGTSRSGRCARQQRRRGRPWCGRDGPRRHRAHHLRDQLLRPPPAGQSRPPVHANRGQGAIVLVGSLQGILPSPGAGVYGASKVAAAALHDAMACEVEPFGIRVVDCRGGALSHGHRTQAVFRATAAGTLRPAARRTGSCEAQGVLQESADPGEVAETIVALAFRPDPPLRVPVGKHAERYLSGPTAVDRFRDDLRTELAVLSRESAAGVEA